jgi:hypothetical protein
MAFALLAGHNDCCRDQFRYTRMLEFGHFKHQKTDAPALSTILDFLQMLRTMAPGFLPQ